MKTIDISGWVYTIKFRDEVIVDGVEVRGAIDSAERMIELRRDQSLNSAIETILHEIGHAWQSHHAEPADPEAKAQHFATQTWFVHRWLLANQVIEWLECELARPASDEPGPIDWAKIDGAARQRAVVRHVTCGHLSDELAAVFMARAEAIGANPLAGDCYPRIQRNTITGREEVLCLTTYDGIRRRADATGEMQGFTAPEWCGEDGRWVDVWVRPEPPTASRIGVRRRGYPDPTYGVANFAAYACYEPGVDGAPRLVHFWQRMPAYMLLKCAKVLALRDAFPQVCAGLLIPEELQSGPTLQDRRRAQATTFKAPTTADELIAKLQTKGFDSATVRKAIKHVGTEAPDLQDDSPETWANTVADLARKISRGAKISVLVDD